jgi:NAD(P)-dependent dehydrogenase (short-subunit alcohol dehydrogenase family)
MTGERTVLITGGTSGLGYATARAIVTADQHRQVVITGRDPARAKDAARRLGSHVVGLPLDLGSLAAVRRFVDDLANDDTPPMSAIVCNAGIQIISGTTRTQDGVEQTFGVNHLAHFLLVRELLPRLAIPARIVFVSSSTHDPAQHTGMPVPIYPDARTLAYPDDTGTENPAQAGRRRYTTSKLCNVLTTYELARRLDNRATSGITVNAFDPGLMPGTGLARDYHGIQALAWRYLLPALTLIPGLGINTPRRSAAALGRLILDPTLAGTTGRYFSGRREIRSSADSYDLAKAQDLWTTSTELVESRRNPTPTPQPPGSHSPAPATPYPTNLTARDQ